MRNQEETKGADYQAQDGSGSDTSSMQNDGRVPTAQQGGRNNDSNGTKNEPSERRSFFWLSILFDALLFLVTSIYAFFAFHQWQTMNRQADIFKTQAEVMTRQLESMNGSSKQTDRLIKANELLVEQNRRLVELTGEQSDAIKQSATAASASARAAEKGAQVAKESFYIGDRPYIAARNAVLEKLEAGIRPRITVHFVNTGKTPALDAQFGAIVSVGQLPKPEFTNEADLFSQTIKGSAYPSMPEGSTVFMAAGEENEQTVQGDELSSTRVEEIKSGNAFLFVWGGALYKDGLGKSHALAFCLFYDPNDDNFVACPSFNMTK